MSAPFVFICNTPEQMSDLEDLFRNEAVDNIQMRRGNDVVPKLLDAPPAAVFIDWKTDDVQQVVEGIRGEQTLSSVPVILRIPTPDPVALGDAFSWGVDEYIVDGPREQFVALIAAIQKRDTWDAIRAPAGRVVLAHSDRFERVKIARILKRNGFDAFFAGSIEELLDAQKREAFRLVIVSGALLGETRRESWEQIPPPWIITAAADDLPALRERIPERDRVRFFKEGSDAEGITFIMNEILAPSSAGMRRSVRVLYGTPVTFGHKGQSPPMNGYSFNINLGGIYLRSLTPLPLQTKLVLSFSPPFARGKVVAEAQVVWRKQFGEEETASPPGMGLQFIDIWEVDRMAYEAGYNLLLERRRTQGALPGQQSG